MAKGFEEILAQAQPDAQGLRRRSVNWSRHQELYEDPRSDPEREVTATALRLRGYAPAVTGLVHQLAGDEAGARASYDRQQELEQRAAREDSAVSTDWRDALESPGAALGYARKLAINSAGDMLLSLGAGGLVRGLARRGAMNAERRAIADRVADDLSATGIRTPLAADAAARMARQRTQAATPQIAQRQFQDAINETAQVAARRNAGSRARVNRAGRLGGFVGATAGQYPGQVAGSVEELQNTDREGAAAIAAMDTLAAGAGALGELRLLGRVFDNPVAQQAVRGSVRKFIPRVAKEGAKQGLTEGSTEVLQAALQRAGHAYVNENVHMLSREALDDYVANFIGGAVLGFTMGGGVETAAQSGRVAADGMRWTRARAGEAKEAIKARLRAAADRVRRAEAEAEARAAAGGTTADPAADGPPSSAADLFTRARDGIARAGADLREAAGMAAGAVRRFRDAHRARQRDADLDAEADEVLALFDDMMSDKPESGPMGPLFAKAKTTTQQLLMGRLNPEFVAASREEDILRLGRIMEKYVTGQELARVEALTLDRVLNLPESGLSQRTLNAFASAHTAGMLPNIKGMARRMSQDVGPEQYARQDMDPQDASRAVMREDDGEVTDPSDPEAETPENAPDTFGMPEVSASSDRLRPIDRMNSVRAELRSMRQRLGDEEARATEDYARLMDEGRQLMAEARREILGELSGRTVKGRDGKRAFRSAKNNAVFTEFVKSDGSVPAASRRAFEARRRAPDTVEIEGGVDYEADGQTQRRRALLDLGTLIRRQQALIRAEGTKQDSVSARDALLRGLAEAAEVGIRINPDSINVGDIVDSETGRVVLKITPALRASLRGEIAKVKADAPAPRAGSADLIRDFVQSPEGEAAARRELARLDKKAELTEKEAQRRDLLESWLAERTDTDEEGTSEIDHADPESEQRRLVAREAPRGVMGTGARKGDFVPDSSPVSNVTWNSPHEQVLNEFRRARDNAGTPAERAAAARKAGEKIGAAELARELQDGTISQETYDRLIDRLIDRNSRLALNYLQRAMRGNLDRVSVSHAAVDKARPATGREADRQDREGAPANLRAAEVGDKLRQRVLDAGARPAPEQPAAPKVNPGTAKEASAAPPHTTTKEAAEETTKEATKKATKKRVAVALVPKKATKKATKKAAEKQPAEKQAAERAPKDEAPESGKKPAAAKKRVVKKGDDAKAREAQAQQLRQAIAEKKAAAGAAKTATEATPDATSDATSDAAIEAAIRAEAQAAAAAIAEAPPSKHDLKRESGLALSILRALGYTADQIPLIVVKTLDGRPTTGSYRHRLGHILLGDMLVGRERIEVLSHEIGHAVIAAEISKATGVPVDKIVGKDGAALQGDAWMELLAEARPELYAALRADYEAFRAQHTENTNFIAMRAARSQPARIARIRTMARDRGIEGLPTGALARVEYNLSMNEWLADHIGRALLQHKTGSSLVEKFFADIARQLRRVYNLLFKGKKADSWRPAPSVEAWVSSLFDPSVNAVKNATGKTGTAAGAKAAIEGAVVDAVRGDPPAAPPSAPTAKASPPPLPPTAGMAQVMRYVREFLPPQERRILERALSTAAADKAIRNLAAHADPRAVALLDGAKTGLEARIALGYIAWREGYLKLGSQGTNAFATIKSDFKALASGGSQATIRSTTDDLAKLFGLADTENYVERIFQDIASNKVAKLKARNAYDVRRDEAARRGDRQRRWNEIVRHYERINDAISKFLDGKGQRLRESGIPALRRLAATLQKPGGATGDDPGYIAAVRNVNARYTARFRKAFAKIQPDSMRDTSQKTARVITLLQRGTTDFSQEPADVRDVALQVRKLLDEMHDYLTEAGVKVGKKENFFPVMMNVVTETDQARLRDLLMDPDYEAPIRELFAAFQAERGQRQEARPAEQKKQVPPIDPEHETFFQRQREQLNARLKQADEAGQKTIKSLIEVNESFVKAMRTGNIGTIEKHIAAAEKRLARYEGRDSDAARAAAKVITNEIKFARARIRQINEAPGTAADTSPGAPTADGGDLSAMIDNLVKGASPATEFGTRNSTTDPSFRGRNFRSMQFIYDALEEARKSGDAAKIAKHEKNVRIFASLQAKDPVDLLVRYVEPAVKRAEYARRFGDDGRRLEAMLARAKAQGATEAQLAEARDVVKAAIGTYGADGSPTLRAISPALSEKMSGQRAKAFIHNLQAYQNLRLLPLATLSSVVDPMGIAVRSGGEFGETWRSFKKGVRGLFSKAGRESMQEMFDMLGAADDLFAEVAIADPARTSFSNKMNNLLFKYNGLQAWTKATRFMALEAAHKFVLKHGNSADERSVLYRRELGLRAGDVQAAPDGRVRLLTEGELEQLRTRAKRGGPDGDAAKRELRRDERVRNALMQFVDEAILRPNAMQTPLWVSDPYMGLVSQYKAFAYAIYDQIYRRWSIEADRGNHKVLGALLMYIPIMLMAELGREFIQNLGRDERRKNWGFLDYLALAAERTGLYSPRFDAAKEAWEDVERRRVPLSSQVGPTIRQAGDVYDAFRGRRSLGEEIQRAMPGAAVHRRWDEALGV